MEQDGMESGSEKFVKALTRVQGILRPYVIGHIPDFYEAEDLLQEISLALWEGRDRFEEIEDFGAWAMGVARNKVLHARRTKARSKLFFMDALEEQFGESVQRVAPEMEEIRHNLEKCIGKLKPDYRRMVEMKYREQKSSSDIAQAFGKTRNAIFIMFYRIRHILEVCMSESG